MRTSKHIICCILSIVMVLGVFANGFAYAEPSEIDLFQFIQDKYVLQVGEERILTAYIANSGKADSFEFSMSSSASSFVATDESSVFSAVLPVSAPIIGKIKAISPGEAFVSISCSNGASKTCHVIVLDNNPWSADGNMIEGRGETTPSGNDWWAEAIGAYDAWAYVDAHRNELADVTVGIIDNGFDTKHEELDGKMRPLEGYGQNSPADHGTHVAGIIGARNDDKGIRGIADTARLTCVDTNNYNAIQAIEEMIQNDVRVINNSWGFTTYTLDGWIDKVLKKNDTWQWLSILVSESTGLSSDFKKYAEAVEQARFETAIKTLETVITLLLVRDDKEFLIIQSAGNGLDNGGRGIGVDSRNSGSMSAIDESLFNLLSEELRENLAEVGITYQTIDDHIIIVGAVTNNRNESQYKLRPSSNYGDNVDLCAPGEEIVSTVTEHDDTDPKRTSPELDGLIYGEMSGTSMAAPMVSASAALVWQVNPDLTAAEVKDILVSCNRYGAVGVTGEDAGRTYPMLNVGLAVEEAARRKSSRNETDALEQNPSEAAPEVQPPTDSKMHHYQVFENGISSWTEAEQYCESLGGHLATISSEEENSYIYQLMLDSGYTSAYFGLTDSESERTWRWVTGEPLTYQNWAIHEPNSENPNEDYAMFYYKFTDGTWNDGDFGGKTVSGGIAFICEWDDTRYNYPQENQETIVIEPQPSPNDNLASESGLLASGTCGADGDNLTWKLYDDGRLVIEGTGDMADYLFQEAYPLETAPWLMTRGAYRQVDTLLIANGVTSIGNNAFASYYWDKLTNVVVPDSVTIIGKNAFAFLSNLENVTLPASLSYIGEYAFGETGLTDVYYAGSEAEWNAVKKSGEPIFGYLQPPTIHFQSISVVDNTEPFAEQELLAILESNAGHSMDEYVFVDMDHDGTKEIVGVYADQSHKLQLWYCSSDGSRCSLVSSQDELDYYFLDVLEAGSETHVALNISLMVGTNRGFVIVRLDNKNPTLIQSRGGGAYYDGAIRMTDEGDVAVTVEDYDGSLYQGMLLGHTWKDTFLFFDGNAYKEYGAIQLLEDEYLQFQNAQTIKEAIAAEVTQSDTSYLEFSYFFRANGIIHIQCNNHKTNGDIDYLYYTVRYTGAELNPDIGTSNWGQMYPSMSPFEAVFPDSLPANSNSATNDAVQEHASTSENAASITQQKSEQELLSVLEAHAGHSMDKHILVDMNHDGTLELIGGYLDFSDIPVHVWYCSSDGSECVNFNRGRRAIDNYALELSVLNFETESHIAVNSYVSETSGSSSCIIGIREGHPCIIAELNGDVYQNEYADVVFNASNKPESYYDASFDFFNSHGYTVSYLFYDSGEYREYSAVEISENEFLAFQDAQTLKGIIQSEQTGNNTTGIDFTYYIRDNGILQVQCVVHESNGSYLNCFYTVHYVGHVLNLKSIQYSLGFVGSGISDLPLYQGKDGASQINAEVIIAPVQSDSSYQTGIEIIPSEYPFSSAKSIYGAALLDGYNYSVEEKVHIIGETYRNRKVDGKYQAGYASKTNSNNETGYTLSFYYADDLVYYAEVIQGKSILVKLYYWNGELIGCRDYRSDGSLYYFGSSVVASIAHEFQNVYQIGSGGTQYVQTQQNQRSPQTQPITLPASAKSIYGAALQDGNNYSVEDKVKIIGDTYRNRKVDGKYRDGYASKSNSNNETGYKLGFYYGDGLVYYAEVIQGNSILVKLYYWNGQLIGCRDYRGDGNLYYLGSSVLDSIEREFGSVYAIGMNTY